MKILHRVFETYRCMGTAGQRVPEADQVELLSRAQDRVSAEIRYLKDERQAFKRFRKRVSSFETHRSSVKRGQPSLAHRDSGLSRVQTAYRETVMAVPHFDSQYDESLAEHVASELGDELAAALTQSTNFHPDLKRALLDVSRTAVDNRDAVLGILEKEHDDLERKERKCSQMLNEVDAVRSRARARPEFDALRHTRERVSALQERTDALAVERQKFLRFSAEPDSCGFEDAALYLYADWDSPYPVLATVARIGAQIEETKATVDHNIATAT